MKTTNEFEHAYWSQNKYVLGIDEAGRGPLAGELFVVGVVFPIGYENEEIYDSKKLSEKKRKELFEIIYQDALEVHIEVVDIETIDKENIYQATKQAMMRISMKATKVDVVLSDAMPFTTKVDVIDIVKGDQKSISIAAASIVAKVLRDEKMNVYDEMYPEYGFKNHKGYGTKKHKEAIVEYGILPIHRRSYQPVKGMIENDRKIKRNSD